MSSSSENLAAGRNVVVLYDKEAEILRLRLDEQQGDVENVVSNIEAIAIRFFERVRDCSGLNVDDLVPVYILRGGLLLRDGFDELFPSRPAGALLMDRRLALGSPEVKYANVPCPLSSSVYILVDLIMATGATVLAAMSSLYSNVPGFHPRMNRTVIACPFTTQRAISAVGSEFPDAPIYTLWPDMTVDPSGRIVELEFDAGDYAFGGGGRRLVW